jgi:hypothetical protein
MTFQKVKWEIPAKLEFKWPSSLRGDYKVGGQNSLEPDMTKSAVLFLF